MQSETLKLLETNIVRAGAGAGKTRNLSLRVLNWVESFIKEHDRFPKLVVTTFTVKATQELKERLLLFASERENDQLLEYVRSGSYLHISTIHGVLSSLLKKYGHAIGLDSGFEVMSGIENQKFSMRLLRKLMIEDPEFRDLLNSYSFSDLSKYFQMYYEAYLLGKKLSPLGRTDIEKYLSDQAEIFKNASTEVAQMLKSDLMAIGIESKSAENWGNLSSALAGVSKSSDLESIFVAIDQAFVKVARFPTNPAKKPVVYDESRDAAKSLWEDLKDFFKFKEELIPFLDDYEKSNFLFSKLAEKLLRETIKDRLVQSKISMADIELLSSYLMREKPELAYAFSEEYDYWLIDEFQDTSPEQLEILRKLIDDRPYYVVGDPQQSIYFFRGADQRLFLREEKHIEESGGGKQVLMKNYRTEPSTMSFINDFMEQFGFERMETRDEDLLSSGNSAAEFLIAEDSDHENSMVANKIIELLNGGVAPSDICVLGRTKKALEDVASILRLQEVPHYLHTSGSFFEKREVQDLLSLLKFLVHPHDKKNLIGLLRSPWYYIEDTVLYDYSRRKGSLWTNLLDGLSTTPIETLSSLKSYSEEYGVLSALEKAISESGMVEVCRHYDPSGKREANIWKLLVQLRDGEHQSFFSPLEMNRKAEEYASVQNEGELEAAAALEPNRVQLMTIHASKGLEFKHVFVIQMNKKPNLTNSLSFYIGEDSKFSIPVPIGEEGTKRLPPLVKDQVIEVRKRESEESFRLLYVAMTRAESKLYLAWNSEPVKASWIESLNWDLSEGETKKKNYSYNVSYKIEKHNYQRDSQGEIQGRDRWSSDLVSIYQPLETDSVSRLLEQRTEYGRQAKKAEESSFFSAAKFHSQMDKAATGTRIHSVLERFVSAKSIGLDFELNDEESDMIEYVSYLEEEPAFPFNELIHDSHLEWGFVMRHEGRTIEGQVDFWSQDLNGDIWVLDYKSGSSRYGAKAMNQLKIYALALSKMYPNKSINMAAVFIQDKKSIVEKFDSSDDFFGEW